MSRFETLSDFELAVSERLSESLALEFKSKEFPDNPVLTTTDKRNIAKSVSAMANGDGGILVFGVRTEQLDGLDVASKLSPIQEIDRFSVQFEAQCATAISPPIEPLQTRAVGLDDGSSSGYLICYIPQSLNRPHMAVSKGEHRFYRRSFEGNIHMTPSEIRDQILAVREAIIQPEVSLSGGGSFSAGQYWTSVKTGFSFKLINQGRAACRSPFLRVSPSCALQSYSASYVHDRGYWRTEFPAGSLIHVGDSDHCYILNFVAYVRWDILQNQFNLGNSDLTEVVFVQAADSEIHTSAITHIISIKTIELTLSWGAENASIQSTTISFTRQQIARGILAQTTVRDQYRQNVGVWRQDLIDQFIDETAG